MTKLGHFLQFPLFSRFFNGNGEFFCEAERNLSPECRGGFISMRINSF